MSEPGLPFVLETLRAHRLTHVDWRDWLRRHPEYAVKDAGDANFHNEAVQRYNACIAVVQALLGIEEETDE